MRIVLADDHALFRESLASLLTARGYEVVGQAANGGEAVAIAHAQQPNLVLMDLRMPGIDGLAATRQIAESLPQVKVVMLTSSHDDTDLFEAIKAGADGYLLKDLRAEEVFECLDGVARGEPALSASLARKLLAEFGGGRPAAPAAQESSDPDALTPRELEVLEVMVAGTTSNRALATQLGVSENTVRFHVRNILDKLHLNNRAQAVSAALRRGLVDI